METINALLLVRKNNQPVTLTECINGLGALLASPMPRVDMALWLLEKIRAMGIVPLDVYDKVLRITAKAGDAHSAVLVYDACTSGGYTFSPPMFDVLLSTLCAQTQGELVVNKLEEYFNEYIQSLTGHAAFGPAVDTNSPPASLSPNIKSPLGVRLTATQFMAITIAFVRAGRSEQALGVLRAMTEAHHEPTVKMCQALLEESLGRGNNKVWCMVYDA